MNKLLAIILLLFLLCSCSLQPKYTRPEAPVPSDWPGGPAYQNTAGTTASQVQWQDFIQSEPVRKVIDVALVNNRDLRVSALNIEQARATYRSRDRSFTRSLMPPGHSVRAVPESSPEGAALSTELYNVNLGITARELDFFGRIRSLNDQAWNCISPPSCQAQRSDGLVAEIAMLPDTGGSPRDLNSPCPLLPRRKRLRV